MGPKTHTQLGPKTLAKLPLDCYSIGMKTSTNALLVAVLIAGLATPAAAQGKEIANAAKGIVEQTLSQRHFPVRKIPGTKRFVFPEKQTRYFKTEFSRFLEPKVQRIAATQLIKARYDIVSASTKMQEFPYTAFAPDTHAYRVLNGQSVHHDLWRLLAEEEDFYKGEIEHASELWKQAKYFQTLPSPLSDQNFNTLSDQLNHIQNDGLRMELYVSLLSNNLDRFCQDLADYFALEKPFEEGAASYTARHPHGSTLQTLRLVHNPFIDPALKKPIKGFLSKENLTQQDQQAFKQALLAAQDQYKRVQDLIVKDLNGLTAQALTSRAVQDMSAAFDRAIEEVEKFAQEHGRRPQSWSPRSPQENRLANYIDWLTHLSPKWPEPLAGKREQLLTVLKKYEIQYPSFSETMATYSSFVQRTGQAYPRAYGKGVPDEEAKLFDALCYWRFSKNRNWRVERMVREIMETNILPAGESFYY